MLVLGVLRRPLAAWRKDRVLTQMKLVAAIEVTLATIANIERAHNEPSLSTAHKIADVLELDQMIWPLAHVATPYPRKRSAAYAPLEAAGA